MAQNYTSRSYVIKLLNELVRSSIPMTVVELHKRVFASAGAAPLARTPKMTSFEATLRVLQGLGVTVESAGQWSIADRGVKGRRQIAQEPGDSDVLADGGHRGPPAQARGGSGSDNRGGIVEVLEHPVLFCYAADEFNQALDNCLQIYGD